MTSQSKSRSDRLKEAGVRKYGSVKAWKQALREAQKKSRLNYKGDGGFRHMKNNDPDRLKQISEEANRIRWAKK